nr:MGMT family protein [Nitrospiraceae bacterium]
YCGPLPPGLSDFAASVLEETRRIPFGETLTYGELAKRIGRPRAARAVGGALGRNPLPFLIPCHRVVGQGGALTGYSEGVGVKRALLAWEKTLIAP